MGRLGSPWAGWSSEGALSGLSAPPIVVQGSPVAPSPTAAAHCPSAPAPSCAMAAPSDAELIAALEGMITPESVDALSMKKVMKQL